MWLYLFLGICIIGLVVIMYLYYKQKSDPVETIPIFTPEGYIPKEQSVIMSIPKLGPVEPVLSYSNQLYYPTSQLIDTHEPSPIKVPSEVLIVPNNTQIKVPTDSNEVPIEVPTIPNEVPAIPNEVHSTQVPIEVFTQDNHSIQVPMEDIPLEQKEPITPIFFDTNEVTSDFIPKQMPELLDWIDS